MLRKPIPINDLRRHNQGLQVQLQEAWTRVAQSGWYILGPEVEAFEAEFAHYCGRPHAVGLGNGTDALELALRALGIGPGDEVACVANAGMYGTCAILAVGALPRYVEIEARRMTMDPASLDSQLTPRTRAVLVTHLYGQLADMPALMEVASRTGLPIVEDCAQAHGAALAGRKAGAWGQVGCFSFYPTKNLGALGDGGAVVTGDEELARRIRRLRQYGWSSKYRSELAGGRNSRLDELQAAVLRVKLPRLDEWNQARRSIAARYQAGMADLPLQLPPSLAADSVAHLYVVRSDTRDSLREHLRAREVGTDVHYPIPDHRQPSISSQLRERTSLPVTEACAQQILTLPCFPELTDDEVASVIEALNEAARLGILHKKINEG